MNNLNDSLVVAILLTIVFGAVCFYLYSRITQNEKRVNLLENLLLDLKMTTEAQLMGPELLGPDSVEPISGPAPLESEDVDENLPFNGGGGVGAGRQEQETETDDEGRYYQEMLRSIEPRSKTPPSPPSPPSPLAQQKTQQQSTDAESRSAAVLEAARAAVATFASAKMENNYEAMSVKELQATVKQRGLSPVPRVRKDLIEMLKRHDAGESIPSHSGGAGSNSVSGEKTTLDAFLSGGGDDDEQKEGEEGFSMSLNDGGANEEGGLDTQFGGELTDLGADEE